jgi:hypothetical protein
MFDQRADLFRREVANFESLALAHVNLGCTQVAAVVVRRLSAAIYA